MDKKWTKDEIKEMLERNPKAVTRGLLAIYKNQTMDEQLSQSTHYHNGIGFTGADAEILSSFAEQLKRGRNLSYKQFEMAKKKMVKYAGQLARIANGELTLEGVA